MVGGAGRRNSPLPKKLSGPPGPRSTTELRNRSPSSRAPAARLAPSSSAAPPATTGAAALVPENRAPNVALSNPDTAETSGLTRPSLVGPCELYVPSDPEPGGSTAPTATTPALRESTIDVAAENGAWTCCAIPSP